MPKSCVAFGCSNHNMMHDKNLSFSIFPCRVKQKERWERWVNAVKRQNADGSKWEPHGKWVYICSQHFITGRSNSDPQHPDYVPSVFTHRAPPNERQNSRKIERYTAAKRRKISSTITKAAEVTDVSQGFLEKSAEDGWSGREVSTDDEPEVSPPLSSPHKDSPQDKISPDESRDLPEAERAMLYREIDTLRQEKQSLLADVDKMKQDLLMTKCDPEFFKDDDKKCKFYTGLEWQVFKATCDFLEPEIKASKNNLPVRNQILMTIIKLRLDLHFELISQLTGMALSTINNTFWKVIDVINAKLGFLIRWPDRECALPTIPPPFKSHFPRLTSIIDCFEIFIERPKKLKARAEVYSNYKKHSTVKFLISCSPNGAINYLSPAWGGRASDVEIVRKSGFIDPALHVPGDQILADRGFTLQDDFASVCSAELIIPAFTRGKSQLSAKDVENTRSLANVRIHIERVIGLLKKRYTILGGPLTIRMIKCQHEEREDQPIDALCSIEKIVRACSILVNLSPGIVYKE